MIPSSAMVTNLIYIVADVLSTLALIDIARSGWSTKSRLHESKNKEMAWPAWGIAAAYVLNIPASWEDWEDVRMAPEGAQYCRSCRSSIC